MVKEVRWLLQVSHPGQEDWKTHSDRVYTGWFYGGVNDEPSETVLAEYETAVKELDWLDVRLVQEERSHSERVIKETRREAKKDD